MDHQYSSVTRHSVSSMRTTKPKTPFFSNDSTVIWSNSAYNISDDDDKYCYSVGSNGTVLSSLGKDYSNKKKRREFFSMHVKEEELRLREELANEIEKEMEREIMEGILVLVQRLSDLKAKQISRGLKNLHLDKFLRRRSPGSDLGRVSGGCVGEQVCECSDVESTTEKWSYRRKESERNL